jgi:hypothetical protein
MLFDTHFYNEIQSQLKLLEDQHAENEHIFPGSLGPIHEKDLFIGYSDSNIALFDLTLDHYLSKLKYVKEVHIMDSLVQCKRSKQISPISDEYYT